MEKRYQGEKHFRGDLLVNFDVLVLIHLPDIINELRTLSKNCFYKRPHVSSKIRVRRASESGPTVGEGREVAHEQLDILACDESISIKIVYV